MNKKISNLKVVLVEPNGPLNVGSVARLCANFEVDELRIVSPKCDIFSLEAKKMALKGKDYLDRCRIFNSLEQAIFDCDLVLATCGRNDVSKNFPVESPENISKWILSFKSIKSLAIVFGREDRGLSNRELLFSQKIFSIETSKKFPSINLYHAVSIILYELKKWTKKNEKSDLKVFKLASSKQIYDLSLEIEDLLIKVGYLLNHTSFAKITKFKKYIKKANTSSHEIDVMKGIVKQINWFIKNKENKN